MRTIGYLLVLLVIVCRAFGADVSAREFSDDEWRADINQYVKLLNETHINLFHSVSEEEFRGAVKTLLDSVPTLRDYDILMEVVALGAMIGDGHTWTGFGERFAPAYLPLSLYEFEDGVFITRAHSGNEEHVGKQLIAMADVSVDEMLLRAARYTSRDNEWGLLRSRVHWLTNEAFLVREKTVVKGEGVRVTLLASDGKQEQVNIGFVSSKESAEEFEMIPVPPNATL